MEQNLEVKQDSGIRSALEAALILAVGMGFGRFAYTAILPHMVEEGVLSVWAGSVAATLNYGGYLAGSLLAIYIKAHNANRMCLWSIIGTAVFMALLALPLPSLVIIAVRFIAGVFSAFSMVAASLWLLERRGHAHHAPLLFAGVGFGIALSAELIVLADWLQLSSFEMWLMLALLALILGIIVFNGLFRNNSLVGSRHKAKTRNSRSVISIKPLIFCYGLAGLGYIITATYLPFLVHQVLPEIDSSHIWAVFGIGAMPSCFIWHKVHQRLGTQLALQINLGIQALGVALPAMGSSAFHFLLSAVLVGGTFMGTVTIAMSAAQGAAHRTRFNLLAIMTFSYGVGQIVGPLLAEMLRAYSQTFTSSLITGALALLLAGITVIGLVKQPS
ncbi:MULTISPECIES: YbfB/YjiJ family MFS transporter [unclassified Idiomarina]|jgi:MFS family permease|uniref:YbfB/YjiJ family MFS transporter n=1 Tax=unclassified Idiomarina TaxID=2614829 RepID=UPI00257C09DC|nr:MULTISPECIES: YbfB/YjiJ family MFS transporter [unclassified Idiomarina]|tara:strand:- start:4036 stop:5199 length:1164 start_codon:yes stop_codon:yes gene_type:complete